MSLFKNSVKEAPQKLLWEGCTFADFEQEVFRQEKGLFQMGVKEQDLIACYQVPKRKQIALLLACWNLGVSCLIINRYLPKEGVEKALNGLFPKGIFYGEEVVKKEGFSIYPEGSLLLYTSGSSGNPKLAVLSSKALWASAQSAYHFLGLKEKDRYLLSLPLYHVSGIGIVLRSIIAKACLVEEWDGSVTHLSCIPSQLNQIKRRGNLKCVLVGGAPIPLLPKDLPCFSTYGLTEMGSMVTLNFGEGLGHPVEGAKLKVVGGEIWVKGDHLFDGYWKEGKLVRQVGWFPTRDMGRYSEKGLEVFGRKDAQFISGGENIQPEEIEQHLKKMPGVIDAVIAPKKDLRFGFVPVAFVESKEMLSEINLQKALEKHLPKYKVPKRILFMELPKKGLKKDRLQCKNLLEKEKI